MTKKEAKSRLLRAGYSLAEVERIIEEALASGNFDAVIEEYIQRGPGHMPNPDDEPYAPGGPGL